jgi:hypothetical protein
MVGGKSHTISRSVVADSDSSTPDNPESGILQIIDTQFFSSLTSREDIAGANAAKWTSVLVRTGVFDRQKGPPKHRPTCEVEDVEEAVQWAINYEFRRISDRN